MYFCTGLLVPEHSVFRVDFCFGLMLGCSESERPKLVASEGTNLNFLIPRACFRERFRCLRQNSRERYSNQRVKLQVGTK